MNREEAINYLISCGFTEEQLSEVVRALTYQPITKNDLAVSSELEKNSKKLEKDFGELDCISREQALRELKESAEHHANDSREEVLLRRDRDIIRALPSVTPQEPKTGHWVKYGRPRCGEQHYKCTNCDEYFNFGLYSDYYKKAFKYCPNCGCRMVEPQESEG